MDKTYCNLESLNNAALTSGLINSNQWEYALRLAKHRLSILESQQSPVSNAPSSVAVADKLDSRFIADIFIEQNWVTPYQADQLLAGRSKLNLGPYLITDWIGQGGMGNVYKAVHHFMERQCAVKVLPTSKTTAESLQGFMREIRMQAKLDFPYLVRAYDAGHDGNVHYLVTEYVPGMDMRKLVKSNGPLPINQAASIIMQAAQGLQYAHEQGLIHRDVKPSNILVTPDGIAKVSDVGLAGFAADLISDPRAGKVVGTADYLSPEQIKSPLKITPASDVYSLGCTLYYAICGKVPFPGGSTQSKLKRHLSETPWHPRKFAPTLSEEFVDIIADMMEKDPLQRTQTCAEVAARLEPWAMETSSVPPEQWTRGPWMAPPPPAIDLESEMHDNGSEASGLSLETSRQDHSATVTSHKPLTRPGERESKRSPGNKPPLIPSMDSSLPFGQSFNNLSPRPNKQSWQSSPKLLVMLTIAIILPPTLLLGFILGYLFNR